MTPGIAATSVTLASLARGRASPTSIEAFPSANYVVTIATVS